MNQLFGKETAVGSMLRLLQKEIDLIETVKDYPELNSVDFTITDSVKQSPGNINGAMESIDLVVDSHDFKESQPREWLFMVYIAGQNNLHKFVKLNLKSMSEEGSSPNVHVIAQVDEAGKDEITRLYVGKKKIKILEEHEPTEEFISGTQESLYRFVEWGIENFPAKKICLVLWNHGSGAIDPHMWDRNWFFDRDSNVFNFNENTGLLELRPLTKMGTVGDMVLNEVSDKDRGIAFNEEHSVYLTNTDLTEVIERIQDDLLGGREIDIIAFDACLMGMIEVACQINFSVKYMVASEEIVPGNGLPYNRILKKFSGPLLSPEKLALVMTQAYADEYEDVFADFTLSALNLEKIYALKLAMNDVATVLLRLIDSEYGEEFIEMLYAVRVSRKMTTTFFNRDYIDIIHTLQNIKDRVSRFKKLEEIADDVVFLQKAIDYVQQLMTECVISNVHGCNPVKASGLSMYWPRNALHSTYQNSIFGKTTRWKQLLQTYISAVR
jgi:hypothetical protein